MRTFSQWTPAMAKKSVTISEKALPLRLKSSHLLSTATGFETAYSILQMFISEKWKKRVRSKKYFKIIYLGTGLPLRYYTFKKKHSKNFNINNFKYVVPF